MIVIKKIMTDWIEFICELGEFVLFLLIFIWCKK